MNLAGILWIFHLLWTIPTIVSSLKSPSISQFQVRSLPGSPALPTSWAGRLPVPGRKGNEIFFWLFNAENPTYDDNLIIWLNGGPGCSSLIGLTTGNGPISFAGNSTRLIRNQYSWSKLGHVLYLDQPVGTGFSIASEPVQTNEQVTADFALWLQGFLKRFPHLQSKNVHMIGESYAGLFIPYFANALMERNDSLPVNLRSMSLGDGSWGNAAALSSVAMGSYMHSQKNLLNVSDEILSVFSAADKICGFEAVLDEANVYPPRGKIHIPGNPEYVNYRRSPNPDIARRDLAGLGIVNGSCDENPSTPAEVRSSILNSSCYGPCATFSTAENYMYSSSACFDIYDLTHDCSTVDPMPLLQKYFSREDVQSALHIGKSGSYTACNDTIMTALESGDLVQPPEYELLPSLVTTHNLSLHFYNGEMDMLINHIGTELSIQNMTWRGAQGFQKKPSNAFYADNAVPATGNGKSTSATPGTAAGIWAAERGVSYHRFSGAGHSVFATKQRAMFAFVRDVVVGGKAG